MAQFLTYDGKVVSNEKGLGDQIKVWFRGSPEPIAVSVADWKQKKRFEYFDAQKLPRRAAISMYEAAQRQHR